MKKSIAELLASTASNSQPNETIKEHTWGAFKRTADDKVSIDLNVLRNYNVFFATPCYGGNLTDQYFLSVFKASNLLASNGINFRLTTIRNESLITRARNTLTAMFLASECTHLFFIDADIEFQPEDVLRALAYDKDVLVGAYPKKTLPIQYAINFKFLDPERKKVRIENGAAELLDASTGFFCIKREVIEKMIAEHPELHYKNDSNLDPAVTKYCYALFDTMLDKEDSRYLSEDYTFCRRVQAMGGSIWMDLATKLNHVGSYTYEGDVSKIVGGGG